MAEEGSEEKGEQSEDRPEASQPGGAPPNQLTEEEIAMLEQQMRELTVDDLLTQTVVSVLNLTARRIGKEDEIDLDQAQTGIEAVRALLPLLPEEVAKEIREPLSQIQMLYASRSGGEEAPAPENGTEQGDEEPSGAESGQSGPTGGKDPSGSGLWTPPGS